MSDEEIEQLADVISDRVSERVHGALTAFIDALENVVRDNERLQTKVENLEWILYGNEDDDDDDDDLEPVPDDELDVFFDYCDCPRCSGMWGADEDDNEGKPKFD